MSRLEDLIQQLCPDGVEFKKLDDIGRFYSGLSGKSKKDFKDGNAKFISYMNVYTNPSVNLEIYDTVNVDDNEKQNKIQYRDVLFTGSSETPDECGITSVVTKPVNEDIYLNSFCFGYRLNDGDMFLPDFLKHLFRSTSLRKQIIRTANGVTRFNVSKEKMKKVLVPVPPMPVQREIVRILDNFTELTAELSAELTARKKQYEYYRDKLLTFGKDVPMIKLRDVLRKSCSGATPKKGYSRYYEGGTIPWIRTQDVYFNEIYEASSFITQEAVDKTAVKWIPENCVIVAISGASAGRCAINKIKTTTNQHCLNMEIDCSKALYKYIFYCLTNQYNELLSKKQGARGDLNSTLILDIEIPVPPLEEQQRIVNILDRFDTLCNDLTSGLPAEIEARKKQYEYYRDKLLSFKEKI